MTGQILREILRMLKKGWIFIFFFFCLSCEEQAVFHTYQPIENGSWQKDKEYAFTFQVSDTASPYQIIVEIRNTALYPFQNLWLFYDEIQPGGTIVKDTTECMLADDFGKWYGKGFSVFQNEFPVRSGYYFPQEGEYTFRFRQGMRTEALEGIRQIGLRIEKEK